MIRNPLFVTSFLLLGVISNNKAQTNKSPEYLIKNDDTTTWLIKNRSIPPPAGASEILKNSIASTPQPDYNTAQQVPRNDSEWKALIKMVDGGELPQVNEMIGKMKIKVEEKKLNGVSVYAVNPPELSDSYKHTLFFHIHGGGYVFFGGKTCLTEGILIANFLKMAAISVDYRMPPDHPYPAAVDDVIAAYKAVLKDYPGYKIVIGGTSAGGGLTMASVLKMKELKLKLPDAVFLGTPWSDLTKTGDSYFINEGIDRILVTNDGGLAASAKLYANGQDLKNPYLSPIYGDLSGFPPTFLVTGTRDLFLSNTVRAHRKLRDAGVVADLVVIEGMSHADYLIVTDAPESKSVLKDLDSFLKKNL